MDELPPDDIIRTMLQDGANLATIVGALIAFVVAIAPGIIALRRSAAAKIAAANAEARAEEAVRAAQRAADALTGLHAIEQAKLDTSRARVEGNGILLRWLNEAWQQGWDDDAKSGKSRPQFTIVHASIANEAERWAAQLAQSDKFVDEVSTTTPQLGERFWMKIINIRHRE